MAEFSEENYSTINTMEDAADMDWSLTGSFTKAIQQATVQLNDGKSYQYATRWPINDGDVAIIGNTLAKNYEEIDQSPNTGKMGIVTEVWPKMTIKKSQAVELDFVFTKEATKKDITSCIKYLEMPVDYENFQYGIYNEYAIPVTFFVRKMLAAASVIAHADIAGESAVNMAKEYILKFQDVNEVIDHADTGTPIADLQLCLNDMHINSPNALGWYYLPDGEFESEEDEADATEFVNKYAYMGAISIMVRGGFVNMLEAFLSAEPPIKEFYEEMIGYLGNTGNAKALEVISNYEPR